MYRGLEQMVDVKSDGAEDGRESSSVFYCQQLRKLPSGESELNGSTIKLADETI